MTESIALLKIYLISSISIVKLEGYDLFNQSFKFKYQKSKNIGDRTIIFYTSCQPGYFLCFMYNTYVFK
ncbi:hypothetical protein C7B62_07560 [Pleurocapsa sp. CCALA 161]|nr:hypothetical protein C7B62_07560 [Pleurocapsa sp. CCALA 161]